MRVALYVRVSTEEQAKYGISIDAQKDRLLEYANQHNYSVIDIYSDEGVSGGTLHRPELDRLLNDIPNKHIEMILFFKLDRWFRSVSHYYKIQEILDKYGVVWKATDEDYETETGDGRFKVNIMLSVNQQYKDVTSDRIKLTINYKVKNGEVITGSLPYGYTIGEKDGKKIVVKDREKEQVVNDMFKMYKKTNSLMKTTIYLNETYPNLVYKNGFKSGDVSKLMNQTMYYGFYRDNSNYCEPYITKEEWLECKETRTKKNIKGTSDKDIVYLFTGLLKSSCGHKLGGYVNTKQKKPYYAYRCVKYYQNHNCTNNHLVAETRIEKELIEMLPTLFKDLEIEYNKLQAKVESKKQDYSKQINSLENEKKRIITSFQKGWITELEADKKISQIDKNLLEYKSIKTDNNFESINKLKELLNTNWLEMYNTLTKERKREFWREFIDYIYIDIDKYLEKEHFLNVYFK